MRWLCEVNDQYFKAVWNKCRQGQIFKYNFIFILATAITDSRYNGSFIYVYMLYLHNTEKYNLIQAKIGLEMCTCTQTPALIRYMLAIYIRKQCTQHNLTAKYYYIQYIRVFTQHYNINRSMCTYNKVCARDTQHKSYIRLCVRAHAAAVHSYTAHTHTHTNTQHTTHHIRVYVVRTIIVCAALDGARLCMC